MFINRYVDSIQHASSDEFKEAITTGRCFGEEHFIQIVQLDFTDAYNAGLSFKQIYTEKGDTAEMYYRWSVQDFGLPEPIGAPPEKIVKLPLASRRENSLKAVVVVTDHAGHELATLQHEIIQVLGRCLHQHFGNGIVFKITE